MPTSAAGSTDPKAGCLSRALGWMASGCGLLARLGMLAWGVLALAYSNLPWPGLRIGLALAFGAFGVWALWLARGPLRLRARLAFAALFAGVLAWWLCIHPSHDREWRREVAVMPRATITGERVQVHGVRDFDYRSVDDFTVRYTERTFLLTDVRSIDLFVSYWKIGPVAHTFVSFDIEGGEPLCISIEARPEVGEGFDPIASMFKQLELIYVVGTERDVVGVRTSQRDEDVLLYRLRASREDAARLLRVYLDRINALADRPEFYHLLSNSCTINIVRYANAAGRVGRLDVRHVLNGFADRALYRSGSVDTSLPFEELRAKSWINDAARAAEGQPDFSQRIRVGLPVPPPETNAAGGE